MSERQNGRQGGPRSAGWSHLVKGLALATLTLGGCADTTPPPPEAEVALRQDASCNAVDLPALRRRLAATGVDPEREAHLLDETFQELRAQARTASGDARVRALRDMQLLYEAHGDALPDTSRAAARQLYESGAPAPVCGPRIEGTCGDLERDWRWAYCARLGGDHVSPEVALHAAEECLSLADTVQRDCGWEALERIELPLLRAHAHLTGTPDEDTFEKSTMVPKSTREAPMRAHLASLQRYYDIYVTHRPDQARRRFRNGLADFWAGHEAALGLDLAAPLKDAVKEAANNNANGTASHAMRDALVEALGMRATSGQTMDQTVLLAAYPESGPSPLSGELLVLTTAEALSALVARLDVLSEFHDLGCQFRDCSAHPPQTPLAQLWHAVAALPENTPGRETFADVVASGAFGTWNEALGRVAARHGLLIQALADATGLAPFSSDAFRAQNWDATHPFVARLAATVQRGWSRNEGYRVSGQFMPTSPTLYSQVDFERRKRVLGRAINRLTGVRDALDDYESTIVQYVQQRIQASNATANTFGIRQRLEELATQYDEKTAQIAAHQLAGAADRDPLATLQRRLTELEDGLNDGRNYALGSPLPPGQPSTLRITADDSEYTGHATNVAGLTHLPKLHVPRGQTLTLETAGLYSPTCALAESSAKIQDGGRLKDVDLTPSGAKAGPEGFSLTQSASNYKVTSKRENRDLYAGVSLTTQTCASSGAIGEAAGYEAKACLNTELGVRKTWSDSTDRGNNVTSALAFEAGLRLSNTPFTEAPVGSLLVIEMPEGAVDLAQMRAVHLVRTGATQIQPTQSADLYLVVNDRTCDGADTINALEVTPRLMAPATNVARNLAYRVAIVTMWIRSMEDGLLARGETVPYEIEAIRAQARVAVIDGTFDCEDSGEDADDWCSLSGVFWPVASGASAAYKQLPLSAYPPILADLYDAFVTRELVLLQRKLRIAELLRERRALRSVIHATEADLLAALEAETLSAQLPAWTLRNVDSDHLRQQTSSLVSYMRQFAFPILELWYPDVLAEMRNGISSLHGSGVARNKDASDGSTSSLGVAIDELVNLDMSSDLVELVSAVETLIGHLDDLYQDRVVLRDDHIPVHHDVLLSLGAYEALTSPPDDGGDDGWDDWDDSGNTQATVETPSGLPVLAQAPEIWEAIADERTATFSFTPDLLYGSVGDVVPCFRQLPVVHRVALVAVRRSGTASGLKLHRVRLSPGQDYATQGGPRSFTFDVPEHMEKSLSIVWASSAADALSAIAQADTRGEFDDNIYGVSPITSLDVGFQPDSQGNHVGERFGLMTAEEVLVYLDIESSPSVRLDWVSTCGFGQL